MLILIMVLHCGVFDRDIATGSLIWDMDFFQVAIPPESTETYAFDAVGPGGREVYIRTGHDIYTA